MWRRPAKRVLLVEDEPALRPMIARFLRSKGLQVHEASLVSEGIALLTVHPDLVIADFQLPDGSASALLARAQTLLPVPVLIVLSGLATRGEVFNLCKHGVRQFLEKPVSLSQLWEAIELALHTPPEYLPVVRGIVGHQSVQHVLSDVRSAMVTQSLAMAAGNRSRAARLLGVSRQAVQKMMRSPPRVARS
jgi:DNA-binding NtrC family response regulator